MWKWMKRLIGLTFLLVIVLAVFLIPAKVSTQEQFKNVTVNTSLVDLAQEGLSTANVTASGLQTTDNPNGNRNDNNQNKGCHS